MGYDRDGYEKAGCWERKVLRCICGPVVEQGVWSNRTNQELRDLYNDLDIVTDIK
jgi:hypothetical protein